MSFKPPFRKGFTLIELLIVIAIIAILSLVIVITLNPGELLAQSRDSSRLSDLATLNEAIGVYADDQSSASNFSLGSSSVTYVSIPDPTATTTAGTDCSGLGFPSGGAFHCAATSTYRNTNGTGWIPINFSLITSGSPISSLPVDPVNQSSSNLYYTYQTNGATFKLRAVPESQKYLNLAGVNQNIFTLGSNLALDGGSGWVLVPGNSIFGTKNFWVMKYLAVCSDGNGNYINANATAINTYSNYPPFWACTANNNKQIASLPGGWPLTDISQGTAEADCQSIGAHLITNNEWQTIAWNAENQGSNWSGGSVGSGYIYSGHNDDSPAVASPASANDTQGYYGTDGPTSGGGSGGSGTNQLRTLNLSNGNVIWDMAGNLYEWTSDTITGTNEPNSGVTGLQEFTSVTNWGTMTQQTTGPANATWNSSQGIGTLFSEDASDSTVYGFNRGSYLSGGSNAGIENLLLVSIPSPPTSFDEIGFRCSR